jgi:hypothetical protein
MIGSTSAPIPSSGRVIGASPIQPRAIDPPSYPWAL